MLLRQFVSPLIAVLLLAALLSLAVGDRKDALFIAAVLLLNALVGGLQEWRAERRSHALRQLLKVQALVLRDGEAALRDAETLVVGDAVWLESGQVVPADLRLLRSHNLQLDESLLSGESLPVAKQADAALLPETPLAERSTMAHAGSSVARGRGLGLVVATGQATQVGRLAIDLQTIPPCCLVVPAQPGCPPAAAGGVERGSSPARRRCSRRVPIPAGAALPVDRVSGGAPAAWL